MEPVIKPVWSLVQKGFLVAGSESWQPQQQQSYLKMNCAWVDLMPYVRGRFWIHVHKMNGLVCYKLALALALPLTANVNDWNYSPGIAKCEKALPFK